jgi:hypothetical protein
MAKLTKKQEKEYLKFGGHRCPYCNSDNIEGEVGIEVDAFGSTQYVTCFDCDNRWMDCYKLVSILDADGNSPE